MLWPMQNKHPGAKKLALQLQQSYGAKHRTPLPSPVCLHHTTPSPGPVPRRVLPQDRSTIHVCNSSGRRTVAPDKCPQLCPCENEAAGAPKGQAVLLACNDEGQAATQPPDHSVGHMSPTGSGERLTGTGMLSLGGRDSGK